MSKQKSIKVKIKNYETELQFKRIELSECENLLNLKEILSPLFEDKKFLEKKAGNLASESAKRITELQKHIQELKPKRNYKE